MDSSPEFTLAQIIEMENIVKELGERSLLRGFCKELASKFRWGQFISVGRLDLLHVSFSLCGRTPASTGDEFGGSNPRNNALSHLALQSSGERAPPSVRSDSQVSPAQQVSMVPRDEDMSLTLHYRSATKKSSSSHGSLKPAIMWKQVQHWFRDRLQQVDTNVDSSPQDLNLCIESMDLSVTDIPSSALVRFNAESSAPDNIDCKKVKPSDLLELRFEALSSRDDAWYDVATFLSYRISYHGELEVRVRFSGFSKEDDEWVNVRRGVRERSIPLEPSECQRISVGDLVLCFRERMSHAIYCDAHIVGVHRRSHDATSCLCIFMVRYANDNTEEQVLLDRLCIRPT